MSCSTCRRILLFWPVLSILAAALILWFVAMRRDRVVEYERWDEPEDGIQVDPRPPSTYDEWLAAVLERTYG